MPNFTVSIPVKPYVKTFLEKNCGAPVDLSKLPKIKNIFTNYLKKPSHRRQSQYEELPLIYSETVIIKISEDEFYRYGWELTKTDIISFGKEIELNAKALMRNIVGIKYAIGLPIKDSIESFQINFGFSEDNWSYEAIKKDFYRNGTHNTVDFENEIFNKIEGIILDNLSLIGTISQSFKKQHIQHENIM